MRLALIVCLIIICGRFVSLGGPRPSPTGNQNDPLRLPDEKHLRNIRQLTSAAKTPKPIFPPTARS